MKLRPSQASGKIQFHVSPVVSSLYRIQNFEVLHDVSWVPEDGVGVEILGGIKPELELHLPVPLPLGEHIGVQSVRVSAEIPEELEVDLVMSRSLRRQLQ